MSVCEVISAQNERTATGLPPDFRRSEKSFDEIGFKAIFQGTSNIVAEHTLIVFFSPIKQRGRNVATKHHYDFVLLYFGTVLATAHAFNF